MVMSPAGAECDCNICLVWWRALWRECLSPRELLWKQTAWQYPPENNCWPDCTISTVFFFVYFLPSFNLLHYITMQIKICIPRLFYFAIVFNYVTTVALICRSFLCRKWVEFSKAAIITSCLCYLHLCVCVCVCVPVCLVRACALCEKGKRGEE